MKAHKSRFIASALGLIAFAGLSQAGPIGNGTFETGTLGPWTSTGNVLVQGAFPTSTGPLTGSFQAWMSTDDAGQLLGTDPAGLEAFFGMPAGSLAGLTGGTPDRGSGIVQTFDGTAGDVVGFDFNFITADTFPDFAFYVIVDPGGGLAASIWNTSMPLNAIGAPYSESGVKHIDLNLLLTGVYKIGFGVINVDDDSTDSILLVDNVTQKTGSAAVPEPSTWGFMAAGLAIIVGAGLRKRGLLSNRVLTLAGMVALTSYVASAQLIINEFRVRGPSGANDEFIEVYNNSGSDHTVAGGGTGYAIAASNGVARCVIPNGTVIPNGGHYLCTNSVAYSLSSYPAGNGTSATGNATYTTDIPDNAGIALFNTSVAANFVLANRMDAVGSTSEADTLYKEGTGYPALTPFSIDYSFYRDLLPGGFPKDTNNNAADFLFVDTNGTSAGAGQRLGAPGPENLSSPIQRNSTIVCTLLEPTVGASSPPNYVRDLTVDPSNNSTFGTISYRRACTNNTGANITRLRFRVISINTFPVPSGTADLRPRTSSSVVVNSATHGLVTVDGTTLEQPPSQPNGGGFNSSLSDNTVTLGTPVVNGGTVFVQWLMGVQQTGREKFIVNVEALP